MAFRLSGLDANEFEKLFGLSDEALEAVGARRVIAEPGFPCRITLKDAPVGEPVLLLTYEHLKGSTPYRSCGPIFVREGRHPTAVLDQIPDEMRARLYSVRAYDAGNMMVDADVVLGAALNPVIEGFLARPEVAYLHLHHAKRGCYACKVDRA